MRHPPSTPRGAFLGAVAAAILVVVCGTQALADEAGWQAFAGRSAIALMRHAHAPGVSDPADFAIGDCATQRNLDGRGREQARRIGETIRDRGIAVDRVLTSAWCRTRETARLLDLAPVEDLPALNSFFRRTGRRDAQTDALRAYLAARGDDERLVLVTHQVNILALTGRRTQSGEMIVVDVEADGTVDVLGEIAIPVP